MLGAAILGLVVGWTLRGFGIPEPWPLVFALAPVVLYTVVSTERDRGPRAAGADPLGGDDQ